MVLRDAATGTGGTAAASGGRPTDASPLVEASLPAGDAAAAPPSCGNGRIDCNRRPEDGCETNVTSDPDHCGQCDFVCSAAGVATRGCDHGRCKPACFGSNADCNTTANDGCESDTDSDPDNCGTCHHPCSAAGTSSRVCDHGVCQIACDADHGSCDGKPDNGCEADFKTNPDHCGACDTVCSGSGASARACVDGVCKPVCDADHLDCNQVNNDGCELDKKTDPDNCGACGFACSGIEVEKRVCTAGSCTPVCSTGFGDCKKGTPAYDDGCETDITVVTACGACNHDCLGGSCTAEKCQPVTLGSALETPKSVTIDTNYVHWVDGGSTDGRVVRSGLLGGGATPVVSNQAAPTGIVSDGQYVFWTNQSGSAPAVRRIASGGNTVVEITDNVYSSLVQAPGPIAADATYLYFGESIGRKVLRSTKLEGTAPIKVTPSTLASNPISLAVDSTNAYFVWFGGMGRAPLDGTGTTTTIPGGAVTQAIAIDATYLYFFTYSNATTLWAISRLPKTLVGSAQTVLTLSDANPKALAVDGSYVYYTTSTSLYRVPKGGGAAQLLSSSVLFTVDIKLTSNAVYWVNQGDMNSDGSVMKLAL